MMRERGKKRGKEKENQRERIENIREEKLNYDFLE